MSTRVRMFGRHSCISSTFSAVVLCGVCFFRSLEIDFVKTLIFFVLNIIMLTIILNYNVSIKSTVLSQTL